MVWFRVKHPRSQRHVKLNPFPTQVLEPQYPQITRASLQGRIDNVRNQSQIIFFIDEEDPNDGWWVPWQPAHDFIGERHNGRGTVSFVDGHLELRNREFSRSPENYDPDYGL